MPPERPRMRRGGPPPPPLLVRPGAAHVPPLLAPRAASSVAIGTSALPIAIFARLSFAIRILAALAPSYIHPDEVFQAQEVVSSAFLGVAGNVPWEFATCANPFRSSVPP
jgi:hypothetical protein